MNNSDYFNNALHDVIFENACGAAIRRLADLSMPVSYIIKQLDYPISFERVQKYVWQYYLDNKTLLSPDDKTEFKEEDGYLIITTPQITKTFIKEQGAYGKITYRQVTADSNQKSDNRSNKYIACEFGILKQKKNIEYERLLDMLDSNDKAYISDLPWENKIIYHVINDRMSSIINKLNK